MKSGKERLHSVWVASNHSAVCIRLPARGGCTRRERHTYNIEPTLKRYLVYGYCRRRSAT